MHSTRYTIMFVIGLTSVVALVLSSLFTALKPIHDINEALFNKRAILSAIDTKLDTKVTDMSDDEVEAIFKNSIKQSVIDMSGNIIDEAGVKERGYLGGKAEHIDMKKEKKKAEADRILPVYLYNQAGNNYYIVTVRGNGLWDEIWGNIAIEDDFNTVVGASFDHTGETPGLGAEIKDNANFPAQFVGKELYSDDEYIGLTVRKGGAVNKLHEVDGISGATVTCDGVTEMLQRGLNYYEPYFEKLKAKN